jgi:hypothetical protein
MRVKLIAVTLLCLTLNYVGSVSGQESKEQAQADTGKQYQIVFSTFENNSAGSYSYLRDSIQAMLASRLAARDRVTVLEKTFSQVELNSLKKKGEQKALSIGGEKADYLVTGEIFSLTSGLEIQVDIYPLVPDREILHFSVHSKTPDTLIADVDRLSGDIAQTAFGEKPATPGKATGSEDAGGNKGFVTAHPEEAYKRNVHTGVALVAGSGVATRGRGPQMSATVPVDMRAMAVGDVNGDGDKEILVLSGRNLKLFSTKEKTILQVAETALPQGLVSHAINLADLDGDGQEEVYISATDGLYVSSMIMEYDTAGGFKIVSRNIPWYLRPLFVPGKGWRLAGQKRGLGRIDLVSPGVILLSMEAKNTLSQGERLPLPSSVNLFDFVYADLDGDGFHEIVAVDQKEKLRVYNPGNELMWVSEKNFGGSKIYLGPPRGGMGAENQLRNFTPDEDVQRELTFVPSRIIVTDIDKDGKEEIVVSEGTKIGLSLFNRLRFYDSGAVVSMAWNGSMLTESWRTGNYRGYVAGYGFTLLDEPQRQEKAGNNAPVKSAGRLFVGHLPKSGSLADLIPGGDETGLIVYDLEFSREIHKK